MSDLRESSQPQCIIGMNPDAMASSFGDVASKKKDEANEPSGNLSRAVLMQDMVDGPKHEMSCATVELIVCP